MPDLLMISYCGKLVDMALVDEGLGTYLCVDSLLSSSRIIDSAMDYQVRRARLRIDDEFVDALLLFRDEGTCSHVCVVISHNRLQLGDSAAIKRVLLNVIHKLTSKDWRVADDEWCPSNPRKAGGMV